MDMRQTQDSPLETPIDGLHATAAAPLPFAQNLRARSFLLERPQGNLLVYNSPGLTTAANAIRTAGGATRLFINHGHEAMFGRPGVDVPVFVHERDRHEVARSLQIAGTFSERHRLDDDFEVIPTPGHTPGTTSYLWNSGTRRFLFTGDMLWTQHGQWEVVVLGSSDRAAYLNSLALIRELDFDVLVPWAGVEGERFIDVVSPDQVRERLDAIIARVNAGSNH
jgi:glyoxylase-like metal-dependent hydrolase (beta-lactamase superfamily II)